MLNVVYKVLKFFQIWNLLVTLAVLVCISTRNYITQMKHWYFASMQIFAKVFLKWIFLVKKFREKAFSIDQLNE